MSVESFIWRRLDEIDHREDHPEFWVLSMELRMLRKELNLQSTIVLMQDDDMCTTYAKYYNCFVVHAPEFAFTDELERLYDDITRLIKGKGNNRAVVIAALTFERPMAFRSHDDALAVFDALVELGAEPPNRVRVAMYGPEGLMFTNG